MVLFAGFVYDRCVTKMRQLTLSSMAVDKDVILLSSLREELKLGQDELEDFIIDGMLVAGMGVGLEDFIIDCMLVTGMGVGLEDFIIDYRGFTVCWLQGWGWGWRTSIDCRGFTVCLLR